MEEENAVLDNFSGSQLDLERRDSLIINSDCLKIMRNLCQPTRGKFSEASGAAITQPSFLSPEDRIIFFKTKMFYLLQERRNHKEEIFVEKGVRKFAEVYPPTLSPFSDFRTESRFNYTKRRSQTYSLLQPTDKESDKESAWISTLKGQERMKINAYPHKTGLAKFLENVRKGDQSVLHELEEKILKTTEGAGYANLLKCREIRRASMLLQVFPDYNRLMTSGRDEESQLNNLVSQVRVRIKTFDKLQGFYENTSREDHTAHVFTIMNQDKAEIRPEIAAIGTKYRLYEIDEKKIQKLFAIFKDDYGTAKTTLVADGTQPVVLNRKKQDRVKKYVDDCADFKGNMLVPYVRETNFFFLTFPWKKSDLGQKITDSSLTLDFDSNVQRPNDSTVGT